MKLLLTGGGGQVGAGLARRAGADGIEVTITDRGSLDIADAEAVARMVPGHDLVVNCAAFTNADAAERDMVRAWQVNAAGPGNLAIACGRHGAALIHLSTDCVFDGAKRRPYLERDPVNPLSAFGASKAEGETAVRDTLDRHVIVRTAWLFGAEGRNFVTGMARAGAAGGELRVVADQTGCPTPVATLCDALLHVARRIVAPGFSAWGAYHFCGQPATTWHGFAQAIFAGAAVPPTLIAVTSAESHAAMRPPYAVLDCGRIKREFGIAQPDWRPALRQTLQELGATR